MWIDTPEAQHLLADCTAREPRKVVRTYRFGDMAMVWEPSDPRVGKLKRLYRAAEPEIDTPEWYAWLEAAPEIVIAEAVARGVQKAA